MKKLYILLLSLLASQLGWGQNVTLHGKVVDVADGNPLSGAHIQITGGSGTATDDQGSFSLPCTADAELTISFLGYGTKQLHVSDCSQELTIQLESTGQVLNNIEITASSTKNKSMLYQPTSISKLSEVEIKRGNGLFLDDAINASVPGVFMQRRGVSSGQQFNIRGYGNGVGFRGASNNFDSQGTKVYLNGIPITDAEGLTLMDDIDLGSVGNVEIIKGPAGSLYGLAIAGVVNLETVKPRAGTSSVGQEVMVGNYGLQRYTTHLQVGGERSSLLVNYGHQKSDGFMSHNASSKDFVNIMGEFQPNDKQRITSYFGYSHSYDERGGELTIDQYNNKDYSGNPAYIKNNAHSEIISFRAGFNHHYQFSNHVSNSTSVFASGVSNNSSSAGGWTDKNPINYGLRSTLDMNFSLGNANLTGITGIESQQQYAQIIGYRMTADSSNLAGYNIIGDLRSNQVARTATTSLFTEWSLALPQDLTFTAGLGMSTMSIDLDDRVYVVNNPKPTHYGIDYNNMVSPHFAVNKVFSSQLSVYAAYSKGYKAPVSSNIVISTTGELNSGLRPEIGNQFEIGTKGALMNNRLTYQLALFNTTFSDKMTSVAVPLNGTTTAYSYIANGGQQDNKGIEFQARYELAQAGSPAFNSIRPFFNFTYSDFTYKDFAYESISGGQPVSVDYSGNAVAGVAPVVANLGIDASMKSGLYGNLTYMYRDAMPITSDGSFETSSYSLVNGKVGFRKTVSGHVSLDLYLGANNLGGVQYYNMVFVNQLPDAYLPAPARTNYFGGLKFNYQF